MDFLSNLEDTDDYICCRICGRKFKKMIQKHLVHHGISTEEYKAFGFPMTSKKFSENVSLKTRASMTFARRKSISVSKSGPYGKYKMHKEKYPDRGIQTDAKKKVLEKARESSRKPESRKLTSKSVKKFWYSLTKEDQDVLTLKKFSSLGKNNYLDYKGYSGKFRSEYELSFVRFLIDNEIKFIYEPEGFEYFDSFGKRHLYFPDFYLIDYDIYVEVKAERFLEDFMTTKYLGVTNKNKRLLVVLEDSLENLTLWKAKHLDAIKVHANQQPSIPVMV